MEDEGTTDTDTQLRYWHQILFNNPVYTFKQPVVQA